MLRGKTMGLCNNIGVSASTDHKGETLFRAWKMEADGI